jgi:hypothetical protein
MLLNVRACADQTGVRSSKCTIAAPMRSCQDSMTTPSRIAMPSYSTVSAKPALSPEAISIGMARIGVILPCASRVSAKVSVVAAVQRSRPGRPSRAAALVFMSA